MVRNTDLERYKELKMTLNHLLYPVQFSKDINLKLERITDLLERIGNPEKSYPVIHVGGTSGKGSTSTMISNILLAAGYKTGLHTSPNIQIINEGFQINNQMASTAQLLEGLKELKPAIDEVARFNPFGCPSYFEVQVALALYLFAKENVDIAIVEVGLGGTLDATNAINAQIAVLTNIGLDHTDILGDTVELIARDKAGIIKTGQTVISGLTQPSTQKIIADRCETKQAVLWQFGEKFDFEVHEDDSFSVLLPGRKYSSLRLNLLGAFQYKNAAIALAAVHAFDANISENDIRQGLLQTRIPGRMEIIQDHPTVLLDGAHNIDKIKAASDAVNKIYPKKNRIIVFALKKGKKYQEIIPQVINNANLLIVTTFSTELWHPLDPEIIASTARRLAPELEIIIEPDPIQAITKALDFSGEEDLIWVTGSLYMVGNVRNYWYPVDKLFETIGHRP